MANSQKYLDEIKQMREGETINRDPQLIGYMVREWPCTEDAGLKDLCWAMCKDGYVHRNDAIYLLDMLEAHLTKRVPDLAESDAPDDPNWPDRDLLGVFDEPA